MTLLCTTVFLFVKRKEEGNSEHSATEPCYMLSLIQPATHPCEILLYFYRSVSDRRKKKKFRPFSGQVVWEKKERAREREAEVTEISPLILEEY